jgi:hypothetical protein
MHPEEKKGGEGTLQANVRSVGWVEVVTPLRVSGSSTTPLLARF